jgi:isoleucyl-tRNA synthetase
MKNLESFEKYNEFPNGNRAEKELEILDFWHKNNIFEKTLTKDSPKGDYIFYEGPPTANGRPGIHHMEARSYKDVFPRFKTMQGYHVRRKGGWDTHGLPVELQVEKELGLSSKHEVEKYGVKEFNEKCKESVWTYVDEWRAFTERMGYWVDMEDPYITYTKNYIESLWNVVGKTEEKKLLYKDYKVVPWCPRCGTALSSHELAQGYADVKDISITAKFRIKNEENTYVLAWTTTPWTLPGNVALAVGEDIGYVKITHEEDVLIVAKDRLEDVMVDKEYEIVEEMTGKDLVGLSYEPLYDFVSQQEDIENSENGWKIYPADFVTTEDGTGVVHTAVMYGQDDFELGNKIGLPKYHLVKQDGTFIKGTGFLEGRFVRDEDLTIDILKDLAGRGLLFSKFKYEHNYPHCWRCKTALIYYARDSWYIRMSDLRDQLVKGNSEIHWEPEHIKDGRFGEWLSGIKDWAISRERYWGTPLPVWVREDGSGYIVMDSFEKLKSYTKSSGNTYTFIRHGESENNVLGTRNGVIEIPFGLTEKGREQVEKASQELKDKNIDFIFHSPFQRATETAKLIADELEIELFADERIREVDFGDREGTELGSDLEGVNLFIDRHPNGENYREIAIRVGEFMDELEEKYQGKNILIVAHGAVGYILKVLEKGLDNAEANNQSDWVLPQNAKTTRIEYKKFPHAGDYVLDPHKPFIDELECVDTDGVKLVRTPEVMDVWFDSGAMPFAQDHYPFENKEKIENSGLPAQFISEAIDQTRGWFYTLHAVANIMGFPRAYENVICLGLLLDDKGAKMSKSKGNIVSPWMAMGKYGSDTVRMWMYTVNQPGDDKAFDDKTVTEVSRKVFGLLGNVVKFYKMFEGDITSSRESTHILDKWILAKTDEITEKVTRELQGYKVMESARALRDFIAELSQWYIRRSRDRFKSKDTKEKDEALSTLRYVLHTTARLLAPFTPAFAEEIWFAVKEENDAESVHLTTWPTHNTPDEEIIKTMSSVRDIVSEALLVRDTAGYKVRQPLQSVSLQQEVPLEYHEIILDEVNVKEVYIIENQSEVVLLDTNITSELKKEGVFREVLRMVQSMRKKAGLVPVDPIVLVVETDEAGKNLLVEYQDKLSNIAGVSEISWQETKGEIVSEFEYSFVIAIQ